MNNNNNYNDNNGNGMVARKEQRHLMQQVIGHIDEQQREGRLHLPANYSASNAVMAAYHLLTAIDFKSSTALIDQVTPDSVAYALQNMATQGLSAAKKQGYFIKYGKTLQWQPSYHGTKAIIKRQRGVRDVWANVVWEGDVINVEYIKGRLTVTTHTHDWLNATGVKEDIKGAYAIVEYDDGTQTCEIMPMSQILTAWATSKNTAVQNKYPQEMAKRTVINRLGKHIINTSDDSDALAASYHETTDERTRVDITPREEIKEKANQEILEMPESPAEVAPTSVEVAEEEAPF